MRRSKEKAIGTQNQISLSSDDEYEETNKPVIEIAAGVRIYESDLKILQTSVGWLNARLMNAGQALLKKRFPKVAGLQDVGKSQTCIFDSKGGEFVQVLNCYNSHWILASK